MSTDKRERVTKKRPSLPAQNSILWRAVRIPPCLKDQKTRMRTGGVSSDFVQISCGGVDSETLVSPRSHSSTWLPPVLGQRTTFWPSHLMKSLPLGSWKFSFKASLPPLDPSTADCLGLGLASHAIWQTQVNRDSVLCPVEVCLPFILPAPSWNGKLHQDCMVFSHTESLES